MGAEERQLCICTGPCPACEGVTVVLYFVCSSSSPFRLYIEKHSVPQEKRITLAEYLQQLKRHRNFLWFVCMNLVQVGAQRLAEHLRGAGWITGAGCQHPSGVQKHEAWFVVGRVQECSLLARLSALSPPPFLSLMSLLSLSSWIHLPAGFCHFCFSSPSIITKCSSVPNFPELGVLPSQLYLPWGPSGPLRQAFNAYILVFEPCCLLFVAVVLTAASSHLLCHCFLLQILVATAVGSLPCPALLCELTSEECFGSWHVVLAPGRQVALQLCSLKASRVASSTAKLLLH